MEGVAEGKVVSSGRAVQVEEAACDLQGKMLVLDTPVLQGCEKCAKLLLLDTKTEVSILGKDIG